MGVKSFLAKQASHPTGWFGKKVIIKLFNQANGPLEDMGLKLMDIQPDSIILEIGFGNGQFISKMSKKLNSGKIQGIDISKGMMEEAQKKNRQLISSGMVKLTKASVEKIPAKNETFDKIFTANTIYFWPNLDANIQEIKRTLKSGGTFYCALRPENEMAKNRIIKANRNTFKNLFSSKTIKEFFEQAGFSDVEVHTKNSQPYKNIIAVGTKR